MLRSFLAIGISLILLRPAACPGEHADGSANQKKGHNVPTYARLMPKVDCQKAFVNKPLEEVLLFIHDDLFQKHGHAVFFVSAGSPAELKRRVTLTVTRGMMYLDLVEAAMHQLNLVHWSKADDGVVFFTRRGSSNR